MVATRKQVRFRKLRDIDLDAFKEDIRTSQLVTSPAEDVEALSVQFDNTMSELLDSHALEILRCITLRPHAPWYDDAIRPEKRARRHCECQYRKSGLEVNRQIYKTRCKKYF